MTEVVVFQEIFRELGGSSKAVVTIFMPCKRFAWVAEFDEYSELWECSFDLDIDGSTQNSKATGDTSLQAIHLAEERITHQLMLNGQIWESNSGMPLWILFPKQIPIAWGKEFYDQACQLVKQEEKKLISDIEKRNPNSN